MRTSAAVRCGVFRGVWPAVIVAVWVFGGCASATPVETGALAMPPGPPASASSEEAGGEAMALALLDRVSIIGASQSAGFGEGEPLHQVLRAALHDDVQIFDASSSAHFVEPRTVGETQVLAAKLRRPTLVIATDFLFWYAHGDKPFEQRLTDLHEGMQLLASLEVPLMVGDLPDVSAASTRMIGRSQIPSAEERARLNAEIRGWAAENSEISVLPLAAWMATLGEGGTIEVRGRALDPEAGELLQWDGLHPTPRGQAVLVLLVLSEFERVHGFVGAAIEQRDPEAFLRHYEEAFEPVNAASLPPAPGSPSRGPDPGGPVAGANRSPDPENGLVQP